MASHRTIQSRITTGSAVLLSIAFAVVGAALLLVSGLDSLADDRAWSAFLSQLGGLLLATGLITIAWDLFGRRAFADEVLAKAKLSTDVVASGLTRVTDQYLDDVEWADLFQDVRKLDIFVAYASTWRHAQIGKLQTAAGRSECSIRIFLPDYRDSTTVAQLADRFGMTDVDLTSKIQEAIRDFRGFATAGGATVEVYLRKGDSVFSCYRFDSKAVLTLYSHSRQRRTHVPTFVMSNGSMFQYVRDELEAIEQQSQLAP